ncbi:tail protein [Methylobacterium sp. GXF4]|uniref:hypothetical protein n=1 Tax=Methylobacterium sp. GXF4 TaxID=1096546 RepID=UPI0002698F65|nr:hypothetical protein [Methylobacterium sp. GXF4]EIZ87168.1 tail protein [Methylobacterium sp. GXF4]
MTRSLPILVLDFDGVLHSYTSGWKGADIVIDPPVPGAKEFIQAAVKKFEVAVVSSRSHEPGGAEAMARWMAEYFEGVLVYNAIGGEHRVMFDGGSIRFPMHKPPAFVTIDDRAIQFTGEWPDVDGLLAFKPWNKKDGIEKGHMPLGDAQDPPVDLMALEAALDIWKAVPELLERSRPQAVSRIQLRIESAIKAALDRHEALGCRRTR